MDRFEKKFGRYAVSRLSQKLIFLYIAGYVLYYLQQLMNLNVFSLLTLDVTAVLSGQIWRVVTWLLVPPDSGGNLFFVAIMLYFYYNIGTSLEHVWGDFKYNVYIFLGIFLTILSAFLWAGFMRILGVSGIQLVTLTKFAAPYFSTYYINMSIFLAFALTFPEAQVYLFFMLPIKVKYLGWVDLGFLLISLVTGNSAQRFVVGAALLNVLLLYTRSRSWIRISPGQVLRRKKFRRSFEEGRRAAPRPAHGNGAIHRCAICGRTEQDGDLDFRYCSKCEGGLEYCQDHLFSHIHVKKGEKPRMMPREQGQDSV